MKLSEGQRAVALGTGLGMVTGAMAIFAMVVTLRESAGLVALAVAMVAGPAFLLAGSGLIFLWITSRPVGGNTESYINLKV
jgi:hypothetical protein